jgi:4a-hydroxytetrahydrobiopterin dehydratase
MADMVLARAMLDSYLQTLPEWEYDIVAKHIKKTYTRPNFADALTLVNKIGEEAERVQHHPDILLHNWNKVTVMLSSHDAGGVTERDISLARAIDLLSTIAT